MKKLVKTAKQQFEERLSELTLIKKYASTDIDLYYLCENEHHEMSILREINDKEFYEQKYAMPYSELINSEDFLHEVTMRFIEHHNEPVKPLFDWYASADKDNEPFTLDDIWMCSLEDRDLSEVFSDLYEEVSDVRIITAKEQWEEASKNARDIPSHDGCTCRFEETEEGLVFYMYHFNSYESYYFPSFDELRKDGDFVSAYIGIVQKSHPEDLSYAIQWLADGKYNMSDVTLWDIKEALEGCEDEHIFFVDKEVSQRQSIEQLLALTTEQQEAVKMIEEGMRRFRELNGVILQYHDYNEFYVVNGEHFELESANGFACNSLEANGCVNVSEMVQKQTIDLDIDKWIIDGSVYASPIN